jgi:hypothetical protein
VPAQGHVDRVACVRSLPFGGYESRWLHIKDNYVNGPAFATLPAPRRVRPSPTTPSTE